MNKTTPWQRCRLTARTEDGKAVFACSGTPEKNAQAIQEVLNRLAEYEDLAAEGRLRMIEKPYGTKCGTCEYWRRCRTTAAGTCVLSNRVLYQSHAACKAYERRADDNGQ